MTTRGARVPDDACRLLVVTYYFDPDGAVGSLRWLGITKYLARRGWKVSVVTAAPPAGNRELPSTQVECCPRLWTFVDALRLLRRLALRRADGSSASPVMQSSGPRRLQRELRRELAAFLSFPDESRGWMFRAALRTRLLIRRFRPQVIVSSGPPHSAHLVARMATIGSRVPWWIDLRDPWGGPYTKAWNSHVRIGSRTFRTLSQFLERLAFTAADGVITNTHQLARALAMRYPDLPIQCVPNGVDSERLPPPARHRYPGLGIVHAGTLYGGRDLGPVVRALRMFFEHHPEAAQAGTKLRIAGQADACHARAFNDMVGAAAIEQHVEALGRLSRAEALNVVSRSHLAVVLAQDQELQIPAKLYESVAMGIPTLVVASLDSAAGLEAKRVGAEVRDPGDVTGIARVLEQLWQDGSRAPAPCPVPITYEAIALQVERLLGMNPQSG